MKGHDRIAGVTLCRRRPQRGVTICQRKRILKRTAEFRKTFKPKFLKRHVNIRNKKY